jgi:excisionase family DNA binding protein
MEIQMVTSALGFVRVGQDESLLTPKEAAAELRVSKSYLDKLRVYGGGPQFLRFGRRKILYRKSDLDLWARERRYGSTSEYSDQTCHRENDPRASARRRLK